MRPWIPTYNREKWRCMEKEKEKKKPVHRILFGHVEAAIWDNENGKGSLNRNVTITRSYHDGERMKNTNTLWRDDLLTVSLAAQEAYKWICGNPPAKDAEEECEV